MKLAASILAVIGVLLGVFGWWGLFTRAGQRRFDEMDGLYPFIAGIVGIVVIVAAIVLFIIAAWRMR
jgi:hypothetical protein